VTISKIFAGIPIRTTLDNSTTVQYSGLIHQLTAKARGTVRDIDPQVKHTVGFFILYFFHSHLAMLLATKVYQSHSLDTLTH
jgi:hypothetical protein